MKRLFLGSWNKGWGLPQAVLTAVGLRQSVKVPAAEPVVFQPAYAPVSTDDPLKGLPGHILWYPSLQPLNTPEDVAHRHTCLKLGQRARLFFKYSDTGHYKS